MATAPLQTFGRGPRFLDQEGNLVESEQFGSPYGGRRRAPRYAPQGGGDPFYQVPAQPAPSPAAAAAEENGGLFNPTIGAPSLAVQSALGTPAANRSLAQKKILLDRQAIEAMSASRGGDNERRRSRAWLSSSRAESYIAKRYCTVPSTWSRAARVVGWSASSSRDQRLGFHSVPASVAAQVSAMRPRSTRCTTIHVTTAGSDVTWLTPRLVARDQTRSPAMT